mmetsp:Transcript_127125/g.220340  ORF Transcript_127125/g.220340 Transcript_127125/m.220340 type:complete len:557 (+) Transcript_127125:80-1750(+)
MLSRIPALRAAVGSSQRLLATAVSRPRAGAEVPVVHADIGPVTAGCSFLALAGVVGAGGFVYWSRSGEDSPVEPEKSVVLMNWSGTHKVTTKRLYSPETQQELRDVVDWANKTGQKLRPLGTGLSPNGLALERSGMLSMVQLDKILSVDKEKMTITVEGGARVSQILDELKKYGLTLANFSSITEQQIGGWTQVSAHGTGARIPTVDEMITRMTIVTPGKGTMELTPEGPNAELFHLAKVAIGSLGIVSEVTLQCVPQYTLHEQTYSTTVDELRKDHAKLLQTYRHVRYMWIPYTDNVVVVLSDVAKPGAKAAACAPESERVKPFVDLLQKLQPDCGSLDGLNFAQLREKLLVIDPLNPDHVAKVNKAEAEFWSLSSGERIANSTEILGFECGGSQWVLENCFPAGTIEKPSLADLDYVIEMKKIIEQERIAAASPIEQRWTARSLGPMSPASSKNRDDIFSWVGVIMYITDEARAPAIKQKFKEYAMRHADQTFKFNGTFHWGKIDLNFHEGRRLEDLRANMRRRFDVKAFLEAKKELDPKGILSNRLVETIFRA